MLVDELTIAECRSALGGGLVRGMKGGNKLVTMLLSISPLRVLEYEGFYMEAIHCRSLVVCSRKPFSGTTSYSPNDILRCVPFYPRCVR